MQTDQSETSVLLASTNQQGYMFHLLTLVFIQAFPSKCAPYAVHDPSAVFFCHYELTPWIKTLDLQVY